MSILTAYRDKQEQKQEHFLHYNVHFVNPNMLMLTFNVFVLGYQGLLFRYFLCFFFHVFSVRSIDPISLNAFDVKRKKGGGGDGLNLNEEMKCTVAVKYLHCRFIFIRFSKLEILYIFYTSCIIYALRVDLLASLA